MINPGCNYLPSLRVFLKWESASTPKLTYLILVKGCILMRWINQLVTSNSKSSWPCRPKCLIYHYLFLYIFFSYVILYRNTLLLIIIIVIIKMSSSQGPHLFFTAAQKSLLTACVNVICIFIFSSHLCLKNLIFFINLSSLSTLWL